MAIFHTDSGSFKDLKVTGSAIISASSGIALQLKSSGSTIFSISGSGGEIFNISDVGGVSSLFSVLSGSITILDVDNTKNVNVSGSLKVTGSTYLRGLTTTATTSVVTIDSSTGQLYYTASSQLPTLPPSFIYTGSVTASTNVTGTVFNVISASNNLMSVSSSGNVGIGTSTPAFKLDVSGSIRGTNNLTITGSTILTGSLLVTGSTNITNNLITTGSTLLTGSLSVTGSGTITSNLTVTGSTRLTGSLSVTGSGTITNNLTVTGSTVLTGSLILTGSAYVTNNVSASTAYISGSGVDRLIVIGSGSSNPLLTVQSPQGELFTVTDSLTGSLFSVNDISGLPILNVISDQTTLIGSYLAPALHATSKIVVGGGITVLYSLPTASYDGAWYDYTIRSGSVGRAGSIIAMWSGSSVNYTEVSASSFGTTTGFVFGVSISGSNMILSGSASTSGWTVKTIIRSI